MLLDTGNSFNDVSLIVWEQVVDPGGKTESTDAMRCPAEPSIMISSFGAS
jgi:hypothetical protein